MRVGLFVSSIEGELAAHTTTRLAHAAVERGHDVFYLDSESFVYGSAEVLGAVARRAPADRGRDFEDFVTKVKTGPPETIRVDELDTLMLRNEPAEDATDRPWAVDLAVVFGHAAKERGVLVLNDPAGLARAANKTYLQEFPAEVRPRTLIARDADAIKSFVDATGGKVVLKPLLGAKGEKVFFLSGASDPNLNQVIDAIREDGYVVVQEFLEEGSEGDVRLFMLDGEPLSHRGRWAAFRRRPSSDELRSNMYSGGTAEPCEIGDAELRIARTMGPRLRRDGMFLVGLDIVGDKVVEVNVQSPAGFTSIERFTGIDFGPVVIEAVERKVAMSSPGRRVTG
ncbi:MAG: glutathione synthase [Actinomycetota bacterium]|nr:glutathione synthase [Actinomycetota bacterium]